MPDLAHSILGELFTGIKGSACRCCALKPDMKRAHASSKRFTRNVLPKPVDPVLLKYVFWGCWLFVFADQYMATGSKGGQLLRFTVSTGSL